LADFEDETALGLFMIIL